jgi:UDP-N-acetylglucosamine 1-carboxyvinyltransferase
MAIFEIEGGIPLKGTVSISGAKNEALKLIAFAVSLNGKVICRNVPDISDIKSQLKIFEKLGGTYYFENNILELDSTEIKSFKVDRDIGCKLRASIVFMGPLLARFKYADIPFPGGCVIGARPIDTHLDAFRQLGARIDETDQYVKLSLDKITNNVVNLTEQSVSATENVLLFASSVVEEIVINNCAIEPEIIDLIEKLNSAGASITKLSERSFKVVGSIDLNLSECCVISDRIEAGSYLIAFIATGGEGRINNFPAKQLASFMDIINSLGARTEVDGSDLLVYPSPELKPFEISTAPYPGFATDLQSPMALIASIANGKSTINELMFENRLGYIDELKKMGLNATIQNKHKAIITGPSKLNATEIESLDLRSGMTILIAALMAEGKSRIMKAELIDRGYEKVVEKLSALGARITRHD